MVGDFEKLGIVGSALVELVVDALHSFSLRVAEFQVLSRIAEDEGGMLSREPDGGAGLYNETLGDLVVDELFGGEF